MMIMMMMMLAGNSGICDIQKKSLLRMAHIQPKKSLCLDLNAFLTKKMNWDHFQGSLPVNTWLVVAKMGYIKLINVTENW